MSEPRITQMDHPGIGGTVNFAGGGERTYSVGATVLYGDYSDGAIVGPYDNGDVPVRQARQQCYTLEENRDDDDATHRNDNPIFGGGGFHGQFTLSDCAALCWDNSNKDAVGRRCVAFEWSDSGNELGDSVTKNCALAWSCTHTKYWGGGSVFVLGGPVACEGSNCP
jgi:hypothetical protein